MRVLVTGGAGYIGSIATALLIEEGFQVTILDDLSSGHERNIPSSARFVNGSILDANKVYQALEDCSAVIHFASKSQVAESVENPDLYYSINVDGSRILLQVMNEREVKLLVFSSSAATYGDATQMPITESEATHPKNPYGSTKLKVEEIINLESLQNGLSAISLRYFNVAGALKTSQGWLSEKHEPETHLIPNVINSSLGNPIKIFGTDWETKDGTCIRDYVHVVDLAKAHIKALTLLRDAGHNVFNLGSGIGFSVREIITTVEDITQRKVHFIEDARRHGDPRILLADISKARNQLNWIPKLSIDDIIRDTFNAMKSELRMN
jgi:UDP-glucose 4-epimerase